MRQNHRSFLRLYRDQDSRCLDCGQLHAMTDLTRHHLVKLADGGANNGAMVLICQTCHDKRHAADRFPPSAGQGEGEMRLAKEGGNAR